MAVKSGAGAAVASGAGYQARVGAYLLACALCEASSELVHGKDIISLSFETAEAVDDLQIRSTDGICRLQVKASIEFSTSPTGELRAAFEQFERQSRSGESIDRFGLVTSGRASRRITYELRAALEAFRTEDEGRFRQDQAKASVALVDEVLVMLADLRSKAGLPPNPEAARALLRRTFVWVLDLEERDPMEQATGLLLQSKGFALPKALWSRLIVDCLDHAKSRRTIDLAQTRPGYEPYRVPAEMPQEMAAEKAIRIEFQGMDLCAGREIALVEVPTEMAKARGVDTKLAVIEFYRFDETGQERLRFEDGFCILGNGERMPLIRRTATWEGMTRMLPREGILEETGITIVQINSEENFDASPYAQVHQEKLRRTALANPKPLQCLHCDRPVSSPDGSLVELSDRDGTNVGFSHQACLLPEDRIIGSVRSELFQRYAELIHFDYEAWVRASNGGQMAFGGLAHFGQTSATIVWAGKPTTMPFGQYVVALKAGDDWQLIVERGRVQRYDRQRAEAIATSFKGQTVEREKDPFCFTSDSKTFGNRSVLLAKFAGRERVMPIEQVEVQRYDARKAARYERPGQWYAPLMLLRSQKDGKLIDVLGAIPVLTEPLDLATYLENWRSAGVEINDYETVSLLSDADFDDFMIAMMTHDVPVVVNPMLDPTTSTPLAGLRVVCMEDLMALRPGTSDLDPEDE